MTDMANRCRPRSSGVLSCRHARLLTRRREFYRMGMPNLKRQWTVADRDQLPNDGNRYEVIDGELFVTPAPAWKHQDAVGRLYRLLSAYLDRARIGCAFVA